MNFIKTSPFEAQELSLQGLRESTKQAKNLCLRYFQLQESGGNAMYTPPVQQAVSISPRAIIMSLMAYILVYAVYQLDLYFSGDASLHFGGGQSKYQIALTTVLVELGILFLLHQSKSAYQMGRYKQRNSIYNTLFKLMFLAIPTMFLISKMMAYDMSDNWLYILPTIGIASLFILGHVGLIWFALKGYLFDGLFLPFLALYNFIMKKRQKKADSGNIWEIEQQLSETVEDLIAQIQYHIGIFSPLLPDNTPNIDYLAPFPAGDRIGFKYIPFTPQFTARETTIINEVFGRDMFAQPTAQVTAPANTLDDRSIENEEMNYSDRSKGLVI